MDLEKVEKCAITFWSFKLIRTKIIQDVNLQTQLYTSCKEFNFVVIIKYLIESPKQ